MSILDLHNEAVKAIAGKCPGHVYSKSMFQEFPRRCKICGEPEPYAQSVTATGTGPIEVDDEPTAVEGQVTRFDLEQQILECWRITDDIPMMEEQKANPADFTSLATVYHFKFQKLWDTFETLVNNKQL